jgi:tRNA pseudouridine38-40 synthase
MQMNDGVKTVEAEVERALFRAGCIARQNYGNLQKISWSRAARTDKGVSALAQLVSVKIGIPGGEANAIHLVNQNLPRDIKCFDMVRVTKSFDAKNK